MRHTATQPCAHRNTCPHLLRLYNSVYPLDTRYLSAHRWWISYQPTVCPCFPFRTAVVCPLCQLCVRCVSISSVFILQTQFSCLQNSCGCPLSTVCPCSCLFCRLSFPVSTTCWGGSDTWLTHSLAKQWHQSHSDDMSSFCAVRHSKIRFVLETVFAMSLRVAPIRQHLETLEMEWALSGRLFCPCRITTVKMLYKF